MSRTIGIFHYKVGGTDGVSLEIEKWKGLLQEMGHTVYLFAGDLGLASGIRIEGFHHQIPEIKRLTSNTFHRLEDWDEEGYQHELQAWVDVIERQLRQHILELGINLLIVQNIWSVALNPAAAVALERVRQNLNLPALAHSHDFYFERPGIALTCPAALELADLYLPPRSSAIKHIVINRLAQNALLKRKGIKAEVVPNVFDFEAPAWTVDDYNRGFRPEIGLADNDLLILQATRIVPRKGIEMAIDFVKALDSPQRRTLLSQRGLYDGRVFSSESRIVLVIAGYAKDDVTGRYKSLLEQKAQRVGVEALFIEDLVAESRHTRDGNKVYALWDTYVFADFVTYPSLWEGWGNKLLEAIWARLPILLFEYPVFKSDLKPKGFKVVSLGDRIAGTDEYGLVKLDPSLLDSAADKAVSWLTDPRSRSAVVEHNFNIASRHYSLKTLQTTLNRLIL